MFGSGRLTGHLTFRVDPVDFIIASRCSVPFPGEGVFASGRLTDHLEVTKASNLWVA